MRLAIDMQACVTDSRYRGIGRYADNLVAEMLAQRQRDEILLALDSGDPVRLRQLRSRLRHQGMHAPTAAMHYPTSAFIDHDEVRAQAAARLRGRFYESLAPDVLLHTSHFETGANYTTAIDWALDRRPATAVIAYDVIPLIYPDRYLPPGHFISDWYPQKCETFKQYDCFLAISQATRNDLMHYLGIESERIHVIDAGLDPDMLALAQASDPIDESVLRRHNIDAPFVLMVGNGDWRKNTMGTVETFARLPRSLQQKYLLVLTQVGDDVKTALAGPFSHIASRVRVLGRVDDAELATLYRACRVFFFPSLYEGFGLPVLEAMAFGAPVICSSSGSLPEVVQDERCLFDPSDAAETVAMLEAALEDETFRGVLIEGAQAHAWSYTWEPCAGKALEALRALSDERLGRESTDEAPEDSKLAVSHDDIQCWSQLVAVAPESGSGLERGLVAAASRGARRILVDITEVVRLDARSGIQRVVRNYCAGLHALGGEIDIEVQPICWTEQGIVFASDYAAERLGIEIDASNAGSLVTARPNDLLLMLDSSWWMPERFDALHEQVWLAGGEVVWMVYDLIPLLVPETCDPQVLPAFSGWLKHAAATADGFVCISEAVRMDLERFLDDQPPHRVARPWTRAVHLGSDLDSGRGAGLPGERVLGIVQSLGNTPWLLAIGTVEPRKDYATMLAGFEQAWSQGVDVALVIVGKHGWNVDLLAKRLREHAEAGKRLFWLEGLCDADLQLLVSKASGLVQASIAEGFGLPLVEAGSQGKPLLLSDIPVFHEIAGDEATYFPVGDDQALGNVLAEGATRGGWRQPHAISTMTWRESSQKLLQEMIE